MIARALAASLLASLAALAGCGNSDTHPPLSVCQMRCETRGVVCGFADTSIVPICNSLCATSPTDDQLTCLEGSPCATLTMASPCGIVVDAGVTDASFDAASTDMACRFFGVDPPCDPAGCMAAFSSGPWQGAACTVSGMSCFFWCTPSSGWEVTCGGDGKVECLDNRCQPGADLQMVCGP
jgi:hypothetical protein